MAKGRKPDSDVVRDIKGSKGKRAGAAVGLLPALGTIQPGAKLSPRQVEIWNGLVPELERMNFVRPTDAQAFTRYVATVERYWHTTQQLDREGSVYWTETPHGKMRRIHPAFLIQDRLNRRLVEMEDRFGLTPASRQQILLRLASVQPQLNLQAGGAPADPLAPGAPVAEVPQPGPLGILNRPALIN